VEACVDAIAGRIIERNGGIVLLHDYAAGTEFKPAGLTEDDLDVRVIEVTRGLIERLRAAGLRFTALPAPEPAERSAVVVDQTAADQAVAGQAREGRPADGPAPARRKPAGGGLLAAEDMKSVRLHRAMSKAAGGVLDLLMEIRGGDGPPLFCAHPVIGLSWCYLAVLPHLDASQPVYGLQARGLRRPEPLPASIGEMAQDYADQIRTVQPTGPYHLLGWSLGGNIAFAIAEELERRGEQVGLLAIMDSTLSDLEAITLTNEPWMMFNLVLAQFGYVPALTPAEAEPEARMLELVRRRPGLGLDDWPDQRIRALQRVIKNNVLIARTHQPGRLHCPLLFFSATRNPPSLAEKIQSWRSFVDGPIEVLELDCDHRYMLLPEHVSRIGPALSDGLARVAAARTTSH
jgi:thioesterase domain-containing protein